jgi:N-acetylneuraminic acid mutarotase
MSICLKFVPTNPRTQQWSRLTDLPDGGRAGGALLYISASNSLLFTTGATRPHAGLRDTVDHADTWQLYLNDSSNKWIKRADLPYMGNHVSSTTGIYNGKERHIVFGGQKKENEPAGNQDLVYEWNDTTMKWSALMKMTLPRGHSTTSSIRYGCGLITAGGAVNTRDKTSDISYYAINTNTWHKIGNLPEKLNTPVCDVVYNYLDTGKDYLYCQTGHVGGEFSFRAEIQRS